MLSKKQISITSIVGGIMLFGALASTTEQWWPRVGWATPNQLEAAIANQRTAIGILSDKIRCAQWKVELDLLYTQVNGAPNIRLRDQITYQRRLMDDTNCVRFGVY